MKKFIVCAMWALFSMSCLLSCTTDVELCPEPLDAHPHRATVTYSFNWNSQHTQRPDSMYVLAYRVINLWKSSMVVTAEDNPAKGHWMWPLDELANNYPATDDTEDNAPDVSPDDEEENPEEGPGDDEGEDLMILSDAEEEGSAGSSGNEDDKPIDSPDDENDGPVVPQPVDITEFALKSGDYKFIALSRGSADWDYSRVDEYICNDTMRAQSLSMTYKSYVKGDDSLRFTIADWIDYNAYGAADRYVQPSAQAIYYDTIPVRSLRSNGVYHINFAHPQRLTQHIEVHFDVKKKNAEVPFTVDSIFAEIAGIPSTINLSTGYIDIAYTKKIMFKTVLSQKDTEENALVSCSAEIDVPSIVKPSSVDLLMGPGIMQVMVMCSAQDPQNPTRRLSKKFQGIINLYHTLKKADLLVYTDDLQHVKRSRESARLDITEMLIDGEKILESPDDGRGLDQWIQAGDIIVDI